MPVNLLTDACISKVRGALVFWSPASKAKLHGRVQIVDVFSLEVVSGYSRDPQGCLLLHSAPFRRRRPQLEPGQGCTTGS